MGDLATDTAVRARRRALRSDVERGVGDLGPDGRLRRGVRVARRKRGRTATAQRIEITQDDRSILDAMAWSVDDVEGLEHDETIPPDISGPEQLPSIGELVPDDAQPPFPFWNNLDEKPLEFETEWPPDGPRAALWHAWKQPGFMAPTLVLNVAFHTPTRGQDRLLCDGAAPLSTGGLFGWNARVWPAGGQLHASGGGQCLYRPRPT